MTATLQQAQEFVRQTHPNAKVKYHVGENVFALYDGDRRLSEFFAWQSQCWYNAAEVLDLAAKESSAKVVGAPGYGELS